MIEVKARAKTKKQKQNETIFFKIMRTYMKKTWLLGAFGILY